MKLRASAFLAAIPSFIFPFASSWAHSMPHGDILQPPMHVPHGGGTSSSGGGSTLYSSGNEWVWSESPDNGQCQPDTSPPELRFDSSPVDDVVDCPDDVPTVPNVTANDGCDGNLGSVAPTVSVETNEAGFPDCIVRTWSASDSAGNASTWEQVIFLRDVANPTIELPREFHVKVDDKTKKGRIPDFQGFAKDDCELCSFVQTPAAGSGGYPSGHREPVLLVATDGCGRKTTNSTTVVFGCYGCPQGCAPGEGTPKIGSVNLEIGMGRLADGRSAGFLELYVAKTNEWMGTPSELKYLSVGDDRAETIFSPDGVLRQVRSAEALADIVPTGNYSYEIRFYSPTNCLDKTQFYPSTNWSVHYTNYGGGQYLCRYTTTNGCLVNIYDPAWATNWGHAVSGDPFAKWQVAHPWSMPEKLKIAKTRGARTCRYTYAYDEASQTWSLDSGEGLRIETQSSAWNPATSVRTESHVVEDVAGHRALQEYDEYQRFPWGESKILAVQGADGSALSDAQGYYDDPQEPGKYMRVAWEQQSDGGFVWYDYDAQGRVVTEARTWKDADLSAAWPAMNLDHARAVISDYAPVDSADDGLCELQRPRTVVGQIEGVIVSKTYYSFVTNALGDITEIRDECSSAAAGFGDASNLRTITVRHSDSDGPWAAQPASIRHPDGRLDQYAYEQGNYVGDGETPGVFTVGTGEFVKITLNHGTVEHPNGTGKTRAKSSSGIRCTATCCEKPTSSTACNTFVRTGSRKTTTNGGSCCPRGAPTERVATTCGANVADKAWKSTRMAPRPISTTTCWAA